jgi:type II secretory pathway pseudopilin PulG
MIEVAVAIGVIAILAGTVAPLALKALNQQREQKTRENLKIAFESMFGSRDRRVANMRADYGFNPTANLADLRQMTTRTPAALRTYAPDAANGGLPWGWNGPYWTGPTQGAAGGVQVPVDGWGRAFRLVYAGGASPTWRLQSPGPNGVFGGVVNDDIFYPSAAIPVSNHLSMLTINVSRTNPGSITASLPVTVTVTERLNAGLRSAPPTPATAWPQGLAVTESRPWTYHVTSGAVRIMVNGNEQILDLLPGEFQTLKFQFD